MHLFLDTLPYIAGTTASDALWVGLPVLTSAGETMAGRIAASLLTAIGLPEMITSNYEQYKDAAVALANRPDVLRSFGHRILAQRNTTALFDVSSFAHNLEGAYRIMYQRHTAGLPAADFHVGAA
jgi:predicted O-linked N-acetylglucosamine transferase (SPINDLY family)